MFRRRAAVKNTDKIPVRQTEMLHKVDLDSLDVSNLLLDIQKTCVSGEDIERLWEIKTVWLVKNKELEERYEQKRNLMKKLGRSDEEIEEDLLFTAEGWSNVQRICKFGPRCIEKKNNVLGDTQYGIHMNRHYDILTRYMAFKNFISAHFIVVLKVMLGRVMKVKPYLTGEYGCIAPTPNYDTHISETQPDLLNIDIGDAIAYNFAYIYEYDEETILPLNFPSQVVPIAVIECSRTKNRLGRPKSKLLIEQAKMYSRPYNETKPLKQLPKNAPHKKYVEKGRRSTTKLISDVPIEPPTEHSSDETIKKLEKFRRCSSAAGGSGPPLDPTERRNFIWHDYRRKSKFRQKSFYHYSGNWKRSSHPLQKGKNALTSSNKSDDLKNPVNQGKQYENRSTSKERDKNMSDYTSTLSFTHSSEITENGEKGTSLNRIGLTSECEQSLVEPAIWDGDRNTSHISTEAENTSRCDTPTLDEREFSTNVATNVSSLQDKTGDLKAALEPVFVKEEPVWDDGYIKSSASYTSPICVEQRGIRKPAFTDNTWMRSNEFNSCFTPESTSSLNESPTKESSHSSSIPENHKSFHKATKDMVDIVTYKLVPFTATVDKTVSIYHTSNGINIPSKAEIDKIKDPRILRAMGCTIESPKLAGYGSFLRRIKEEPPEDKAYGHLSQNVVCDDTQFTNVPVKKEINETSEVSQTEDDVEKTLKKLNDAIKAIQNEETTSSSDKVHKESKNVISKKTCTAKEQNSEIESNINESINPQDNMDFLPRNMGFSSYLPEYSDGADYERTARVLNEVFKEKFTSPVKKTPMSMTDYFGSSAPSLRPNAHKDENIEEKLSDLQTTRSSKTSKASTDTSMEKVVKEHMSDCKGKEENISQSISKPCETRVNTTEDLQNHSNTSNQQTSISTKTVQVKSETVSKTRPKSRSRSKAKSTPSRTWTEYTSTSVSSPERESSTSRSPSVVKKIRSVVSQTSLPKNKRSRSKSGSSFSRNTKSYSRSPDRKSRKKKHHQKSRSSHSNRKESCDHSKRGHKKKRSRSRSSSVGHKIKRIYKSDELSHSKQVDSKEKPQAIAAKTMTPSRLQERLARENSPGRLQYLEARRKLKMSKRLIAKAKQRISSNEGHSPEDHAREENDIRYQRLLQKGRASENVLDKQFNRKEIDNYFRLQRSRVVNPDGQLKDETAVNTTLSKAMTSLLKKIVFRNDITVDDSAEGRMADMVIELVKDQMSRELRPDVHSVQGPSMPVNVGAMATPPEHPFVPFIKQERDINEIYNDSSWGAQSCLQDVDQFYRVQDQPIYVDNFATNAVNFGQISGELPNFNLNDNDEIPGFKSSHQPYSQENHSSYARENQFDKSGLYSTTFRGKSRPYYHDTKSSRTPSSSSYRGRYKSYHSRGLSSRGGYKRGGRYHRSHSHKFHSSTSVSRQRGDSTRRKFEGKSKRFNTRK